MADQDHDVMSADDLADGEMAGVLVGRWHVLVARTPDGFHALNDRCSHAASRLSTGTLRRQHVMCPRHGARFDVATGTCAGAPYPPIRTFRVRVQDGRILVGLPSIPPDMTEVPIG